MFIDIFIKMTELEDIINCWYTHQEGLGKERHIISPQEIKSLVEGECTATAIDLVVVSPTLGVITIEPSLQYLAA